MYSDVYQTITDVSVNKKIVNYEGSSIVLQLWDLYGEDELQKIKFSYLRGTKGYLLVADGTRPSTLERAYRIYERVEDEIGEVPFIPLLNKFDLVDQWQIDDSDLEMLRGKGWPVLEASAKSGLGVEEAFLKLTLKMLQRNQEC
jgi:small GTP-binding protein